MKLVGKGSLRAVYTVLVLLAFTTTFFVGSPRSSTALKRASREEPNDQHVAPCGTGAQHEAPVSIVVASDSDGTNLDASVFLNSLDRAKRKRTAMNNQLFDSQTKTEIKSFKVEKEPMKQPAALSTPTIHVYIEEIWAKRKALMNQRNWHMINTDVGGGSHVNLQFMELVLCKTHLCVDLLTRAYRAGRRSRGWSFSVMYTAFTSNDIAPGVTTSTSVGKPAQDFNQFLHVAGKSPFKSTGVLLLAWAKHPEWPRLTVVARLSGGDQKLLQQANISQLLAGGKIANIVLHDKRLPLEELRQLQNTIGVHVCPSRFEGYGHYINEGRAASALVVATDAPPMNELISEKSGVLIDWQRMDSTKKLESGEIVPPYMGPFVTISRENIEQAVLKVLAIPMAERRLMGARSRRSFEHDTGHFKNAMRAVQAASACVRLNTEFRNHTTARLAEVARTRAVLASQPVLRENVWYPVQDCRSDDQKQCFYHNVQDVAVRQSEAFTFGGRTFRVNITTAKSNTISWIPVV